MRKVELALGVACGLLLAGSQPAVGGAAWCADDPIVSFQGRSVQLVTQYDATSQGTLKGPVKYVFVVPADIGPVRVSFPDSSDPESVTISFTGPLWGGVGDPTITGTVSVTATASFDTVTTVRGNARDTLKGTSNVLTVFSEDLSSTKWSSLIGDTTSASSYTVKNTQTVSTK